MAEVAPATSEAASETLPAAFKKSKNRSNIRSKRPRDDDDAAYSYGENGAPTDADNREGSAVVRPLKVQKTNQLSQTTKLGKRETEDLSYQSSRSATSASVGSEAGLVTADIQTETEHDQDAVAVQERAGALKEEREQAVEDGKTLYKGLNAYKDYVQRAPTIKGVSAGPSRAPTHIRISCRFDYQPDICKDYKETGYCGYGDSCKFIHDRGDYKTGWQLEKEWEEKTKKEREKQFLRDMGLDEDENDNKAEEKDELPFACFICRQPFGPNPVVTRCGHYFDEKCALDNYTKSTRCFVCQQQTLGIFNRATKIIDKRDRIAKLNAALQTRRDQQSAAAD